MVKELILNFGGFHLHFPEVSDSVHGFPHELSQVDAKSQDVIDEEPVILSELHNSSLPLLPLKLVHEPTYQPTPNFQLLAVHFSSSEDDFHFEAAV